MHRKFIILLLLAVLLIYSSSLRNGFVLDDQVLIVENPLIKSGEAKAIFSSSIYDLPKTYRPIQQLSYSLDYKIWGLNPFGFHLSNIILHILNSVLVYFIICLIATIPLAQAASLMFAVHPVNSSVVAYIGGRADSLAALCMLLSILFFRRFTLPSSKKNYILSLLFAWLALLCRESSLILPLLLFLVLSINPSGLKRFKYILPFLALDLAYIILRVKVFGAQAFWLPFSGLPLFFNALNFLYIILKYLNILILPLNLHMLRTTPFIISLLDPRVLFTFLILTLLGFFLFKERKNKLVLFGAAWFFCGLIPVFFLLSAYPWLKAALLAESWLYLPCVGVFLLVALIMKKLSRVGKFLFIIVVIIFSLLTYQANDYWKDNLSVYRNILKYLPQENPVRKNLIREYLRLGMYAEAATELKKFSQSYPESSERFVLEGDYYFAKGELAQARNSYTEALLINKYDPQALEKLRILQER
ncbi:MAG: glycosyltransferase family 39 protein [Candidatus Omnitrophica bacterium]|nr:glycosyltransferase family 39 protein [Candidatus Omnitrophota bacterium]